MQHRYTVTRDQIGEATAADLKQTVGFVAKRSGEEMWTI